MYRHTDFISGYRFCSKMAPPYKKPRVPPFSFLLPHSRPTPPKTVNLPFSYSQIPRNPPSSLTHSRSLLLSRFFFQWPLRKSVRPSPRGKLRPTPPPPSTTTRTATKVSSSSAKRHRRCISTSMKPRSPHRQESSIQLLRSKYWSSF